MGWKDAGIDEKALFGQDFEGPEGLPGYGKAGGPVCSDRGPAGVLDGVPRSPQVVAKLVGRLVVDEAMFVAVATDFVAGALDVSPRFWLPVRHPTEDEECCLYVVASQ